MEVRDPVHGSIDIRLEEIPIIEHKYFQRLRNIKQLGFSEFIFPGATHTRYLHSIGVMEVAERTFNRLFFDKLASSDIQRLKETFRLGCLLHDIGHAPLSHTTEYVMPQISQLELPKRFAFEDDQATHEHYTLKAIVDSSFTETFKKAEKKYGINCFAVAELILGKTTDPGYFTVGGVNYFPVLHQLVSSEIDCDRMDYLRRDSYFCGVSYGNFDLDWLIDNLKICNIKNEAYLGIAERAISTFDDFLISRFHMFMMVYFHYKGVCLEKMLYKYFETAQGEYTIPANIEAYQEHDDHYLNKILRNSQNTWAKKIVGNKIPTKIFETFGENQLDKFRAIENYLKENKLEHISCSSTGRLSKYYSEGASEENLHSIRVIKMYPGKNENPYPVINEATNLYEKYSKSHAVNRLHCDLDDLAPRHKTEIQNIIQNS
ncbi:MAG: HD domain-containing protein [Bacteriovoracaceae bacterium]|nr:HD domain-containing protein [Bacteriovoracaceae bacterium]